MADAKTLVSSIHLEKPDQTGISVGPIAYITEDAFGEFSAQDVVLRHENNIRGIKNNDEIIGFPLGTPSSWIVFEVYNDTNEEDWLLDFGALSKGRSGIIASLLVYEGKTRQIFFDGLRANASHDNKKIYFNSAIAVTIPSQKTSLFAVYIHPSDYRPLILKPSLIATKNYIENQSVIDSTMVNTIFPFLCLISAILLFFAFLLSKNVGFIPMIIYYIGYLFWFILIERPVFSDLPGADTFPSIIVIAQTLLILGCIFLTVPRQDNASIFRIMMNFSFVICLMVLCAVVIFLNNGSPLRLLSIYGVSFISLIISGILVSTYINKFNRSTNISIILWIGLYLSGNMIIVLSATNILPHNPVFVHADLWIVFPQLFTIFGSVIGTVRGIEKYRLHEAIKKFQKAQTLLKARQTKEASDQSRLLRIIEREREIMAELRGREAERSEEMRKAKIAADEANNSKSAFLAVVSHEIRTPMTGIMGMIRLLEDTPLTKEQRDFAITIKDSGDAMLALLNDILDFSKIESGGMVLETIDFELSRVLNSVVMLMSGHADQKNINLILDMDPQIPPVLHGDPTRLRQIFLNLVGNALKFTSRGYVKIIVRFDTDSPAHKPENNEYALYFAVEDTGIGISKDSQAKLFTPFAQADSSIARKFGGTGLGLTICARLITAMGGKIQIFSREGKGTTFYFTLVLRSLENTVSVSGEEPPQQTAENIPAIDPLHLMIVDDNAINRKVIAGLVERDGHSYDTANSGEAAITLLKKGKSYDGILMDIELPGISGVEATRIIRNELNLSQLPVIALTGNVSAEHKATYQEAGMNDCLAKPIEIERLRAIISQIDAHKKPGSTTGENGTEKPHFAELSPIAGDIVGDKEETTPEPSPRKIVEKVSQLIDEVMLKGLKEGLGTAQTKELLKGLFEKAHEIAPAMKQALDEQDYERLRMRAHELKGMAGNFGLSHLSEQAGMIERTVKSDLSDLDLPSLTRAVDAITILIERSKLAVDKYFN